jgi:signal transduction histidine kinase
VERDAQIRSKPTPRPLFEQVRRFDLVLLATVGILAVASVSTLVWRVQFATAGLDLVINTVTAVAAAAASTLAWVRYRAKRDAGAAYESSAFLVLFATRGVLVVVALLGTQSSLGLTLDSPQQWPVYAWTIARLMTAALLVLAASLELRRPSTAHQGDARMIVGVPVIVVVGLLVLLPAVETSLPIVLDVGQLDSSARGPAMAIVAAVAQAGIAGVYLWGASLYRRLYRERGGAYAAYLSVVLVVAAFAQVHWAIQPGIYAPVVTLDDILRAAMSVVLLIGLEEQSREDVDRLSVANEELEQRRTSEAERAAREAAIARDIHDGMAQELWLAKLKLSRLANVPDLSSEAKALTSEGRVAVDRALEQARAAVASIRERDAGAPFDQSLANAVAAFAEQSGLKVELGGELPEVSPRAASEIVRVVQEALANVRKHADATVVRISIEREGNGSTLTIADNGRGFDVGQASGTGYGIRGMRERAALIGAGLDVVSRPQDGTRVILTLPGATTS